METEKNLNNLPTEIIPKGLELNSLQTIDNLLDIMTVSLELGRNIISALEKDAFNESFSDKINKLSSDNKNIINDYAQSFLAYEIADALQTNIVMAKRDETDMNNISRAESVVAKCKAIYEKSSKIIDSRSETLSDIKKEIEYGIIEFIIEDLYKK